MNLQQLINEITQLEFKAFELDKQRGESQSPLFDKQLFYCLSKTLTPCVKETKSNIEALQNEHKKGILEPKRTAHLCERIIHQISALQRELNTVGLRKKENHFKPKTYSIQDRYQDLAKHQDWERQLFSKIKDTEMKLSKALNYEEKQKFQSYLLHTETRLKKCQEARKKIENYIAKIERKG